MAWLQVCDCRGGWKLGHLVGRVPWVVTLVTSADIRLSSNVSVVTLFVLLLVLSLVGVGGSEVTVSDGLVDSRQVVACLVVLSRRLGMVCRQRCNAALLSIRLRVLTALPRSSLLSTRWAVRAMCRAWNRRLGWFVVPWVPTKRPCRAPRYRTLLCPVRKNTRPDRLG